MTKSITVTALDGIPPIYIPYRSQIFMLAKSGKLQGKTLNIIGLSESLRSDMWILFQRYYTDISQAQFATDLEAKSKVILLIDSGDKSVQGFSTIEIYKRKIAGKAVHAIYSGDTIIASDYWGQSALQIAFAKLLGKQFLLNRLRPIHWFLISKGYKTYLLFSRNLLNYYPRHDQSTPVWEKAVIDTLSREKFGDNWQAHKGVLQFINPAGRLLEGVAPIEQSLVDGYPDIRFFVEKNPGHQQGDELCCIGRIDKSTFLYFISRTLRKTRRMLKS